MTTNRPLDPSDSVWHESAVRLVEERGYADALLYAMKCRDMNSWGTASYAFHNAVVKHIRAMREG
jgi:hypothetical protein